MARSWMLGLVLLAAPGRACPDERLVRNFPVKLDSIRTMQLVYASLWRQAKTEADRELIRGRAREFVVATIVDDIFPAWMGTPWHMGEDDDAILPHQEGKRVSCSMFVTAVLLNAGLRLDSRTAWAQAPALHIQRSLAPQPIDLHRFYGIAPDKLAWRLAALRDGLYVIGLNCHVGFVRVRRGRAFFVHSDYVQPEEGVKSEPVSDSRAILYSQETGYWVTPLFQDDRLIEYWLEGTEVPLQKLGRIRR